MKNVCLTAVAGSNCQPTLTLTAHTAVTPCTALTDDYCPSRRAGSTSLRRSS